MREHVGGWKKYVKKFDYAWGGHLPPQTKSETTCLKRHLDAADPFVREEWPSPVASLYWLFIPGRERRSKVFLHDYVLLHPDSTGKSDGGLFPTKDMQTPPPLSFAPVFMKDAECAETNEGSIF